MTVLFRGQPSMWDSAIGTKQFVYEAFCADVHAYHQLSLPLVRRFRQLSTTFTDALPSLSLTSHSPDPCYTQPRRHAVPEPHVYKLPAQLAPVGAPALAQLPQQWCCPQRLLQAQPNSTLLLHFCSCAAYYFLQNKNKCEITPPSIHSIEIAGIDVLNWVCLL